MSTTVASELRSALSSLNLPIAQNVYRGNAGKYLVFNFEIVPMFNADDEAEFDKYLIQVHLYTDPTDNTTVISDSIRTAIRSAGFKYPSVTNASDDEWQHLVFETETVREALPWPI